MTKEITENTTRRVFIGWVSGALAASLVPVNATETSRFEWNADKLTQMPGFIRDMVAEWIGVSVETVNQWIASPNEETQELIVNSIISLNDLAEAEQRRRLGGAS